jgi:gluconokinase
MGVSGSGKTAVGRRLAERHGASFIDGDDLHPAENIRKMTASAPLDDDDRRPWLLAIRKVIAAHSAGAESAVIACSALKESYRRLLLGGHPEVKLVYLRGERATLRKRLEARSGHFFDPSLLDSQIETLEEPENALVVDIDADLERVVDAVAVASGLSRS